MCAPCADRPALQEWALEYTQSLEAGGRFTHIIWPYHCLIGSKGHAVRLLALKVPTALA